jgi:hypothetical protein
LTGGKTISTINGFRNTNLFEHHRKQHICN